MAGRPKKVDTTEVNEVVTETVTENVNDKVLQENIELKQQMAEMKAMIEQMAKQQIQPIQYVQQSSRAKSVKVMSLVGNTMALTTEEYGRGTLYLFKKFGDCLSIPFDDLEKIKNTERKFLEAGAFYICDQNAVDELYLTEIYENVVNDKVVKNVVELKSDGDVDILIGMNDFMKGKIINMLIENIANGREYDMNRIFKIQNALNINLMQKAEDFKEDIKQPK